MNYYEHHLGDYAKDAGHLSLIEEGAYRRLLDAYYIRERPLPSDVRECCKLARATTKAERDAVAYVLAEFFTLDPNDPGDGHRQSRADEEIARFQDKRAKAKASADARWEGSEGNANAYANASRPDMRTHSERNAPRTRARAHTATGARPSPVPSPQSPEKETSLLSQAPARPMAEPPALQLVGEPSKGPPDCPHRDVLALWAEALPAMPQHLQSQWRGSRADHLRARWRETAVAKGWRTQADGLSYFRRLFAYIGQSAFLTGRAAPAPGKRPFLIELEWLVNPTNWAKVHEGKYHPEQAA